MYKYLYRMIKETNEQKILNFFFDFPTEKFHIREIARKTKLNPNTILNAVKFLIKEKLLVKEKKTNLVEVWANRNENFKTLKRLVNIKRLYESGLTNELKEIFSPSLISVIGSYSRGEDIEISDIDIFVLSEKKQDLKIEKYEKKLKRKIHLIVSNYKNISEEFYANLINGVVLEGFIEKK